MTRRKSIGSTKTSFDFHITAEMVRKGLKAMAGTDPHSPSEKAEALCDAFIEMLGAYYRADEMEFIGPSPFEADVYGNSRADAATPLVAFRLMLHDSIDTRTR
jgi:hypothetical protein